MCSGSPSTCVRSASLKYRARGTSSCWLTRWARRSRTERERRTRRRRGAERRGVISMRQTLAAMVIVAVAIWMTTPVRGGQAAVGAPGNRQPRPPSAARIAPLPESEWTAEQRAAVAKIAPADPATRTLVRLPALVQAVAPYTRYLTTESTLPARVRQLLILRTAWLCGNDVLWSLHASGLPAEERRRVAQGVSAPGWSEADQTLLKMADELFRLSSVSDATWRAISAAYDLHGVMDIVETVNHFTAMSLLYNSLGIQVEDRGAERLPRDVPYVIAPGGREPALRQARIAPAEGTGIAVSRTL